MISFGLIGYGYLGPDLARCTSESEVGRLAAIHDLDPNALQRTVRRHPGTRAVTDANDLINDLEIDAVIIAIEPPCDGDRQALAAEVVEGRRHAEFPAIMGALLHEVAGLHVSLMSWAQTRE